MIYVYEEVERIPKELKPGVLYHNPDFELAELLCACGCGHRITLLVPDSHQIDARDALPTVSPSIAACDAPCGSHFFIRSGKVEWMRAFSPDVANAVMRGQINRHASADRKSTSRLERWRRELGGVVNKVRAFFRIG